MCAIYRPFFGDIIGAVGGVVYQRGKGASVLRAKGRTSQVKTPTNTLNQSRFKSHLDAWTYDLTEAQRIDWKALAARTTYQDKFGNTFYLSGQNLFTKSNTNLLNGGIAALLDAPPNSRVTSLQMAAIPAGDLRDGNEEISVEFNPVLKVYEKLVVWGALNIGISINNFESSLSLWGYSPMPATSPQSSIFIQARLGKPIAGVTSGISIGVLNTQNGFLSSRIMSTMEAVEAP